MKRAAAKQLSDLARKTFLLSSSSEGEAGPSKPNLQDVKADTDTSLELGSTAGYEDAWTDVLATVSKILPLLSSRVTDTRHAAAIALGLLASSLPRPPPTEAAWEPPDPLDIPTVLRSHPALLASEGREYIAKPNKADKAKARKAMMGSLGLSEAVGLGDDADKMLDDDDDDVELVKKELAPVVLEQPRDIFEGLSARQITMLKRKKGNLAEEANKWDRR